jgi:hypothetical protein
MLRNTRLTLTYSGRERFRSTTISVPSVRGSGGLIGKRRGGRSKSSRRSPAREGVGPSSWNCYLDVVGGLACLCKLNRPDQRQYERKCEVQSNLVRGRRFWMGLKTWQAAMLLTTWEILTLVEPNYFCQLRTYQLTHVCYMTTRIIFLDFIALIVIIFGEEYTWWSSLSCYCLLSLRSKYSSHHFVLTSSIYFIPSVQETMFHDHTKQRCSAASTLSQRLAARRFRIWSICLHSMAIIKMLLKIDTTTATRIIYYWMTSFNTFVDLLLY